MSACTARPPPFSFMELFPQDNSAAAIAQSAWCRLRDRQAQEAQCGTRHWYENHAVWPDTDLAPLVTMVS